MAALKHSLLMVVVVSLLLEDVRGAPPVFLVHPLVITSNAQLAIQGHPRVLLARMGDGGMVEQQSQVTQVEDYDEGVEESRDWKEEDESANETEDSQSEGKYDEEGSSDYTEKTDQDSEKEENKDSSDDGSYHGNFELEDKTEENGEDTSESDDGSYHETGDKVEEQEKDSDDGLYHQNDESEDKTGGQEVQQDGTGTDDGSYHENDESGDKTEEQGKYGNENDSDDGSYHPDKESNEGQSAQESYDGKNEPINWSENREGKSEKGELGSYQKVQTNTDSKRDTSKVTEEIDSKSRQGKTLVDKEVSGKDNNPVEPLHVPEEIVIGSVEKAQVEVSKTQGLSIAATGTDVKDSSAAVKLNPPLKETEEVQLAPVVYHVSPKLQQKLEPPIAA